MQAKDIMTSPVITVTPDSDIRETAQRLLEHRISAVPVVDKAGRLVGIISESDLMRREDAGTGRQASWWLSLFSDPERHMRAYVKSHSLRVADVMTSNVVTVEEDTPVDEVADLLGRKGIKRVPVMRNGAVVGIVSRADLLRGLIARRASREASADDRAIKAAVLKGFAEAGVNERLLNVVVSGGTVHIWGVAESEKERDAIRVAAESAPGVGRVQCNVDAIPDSARKVLWPD
jgi:CBS-domain-containing membrane protein